MIDFNDQTSGYFHQYPAIFSSSLARGYLRQNRLFFLEEKMSPPGVLRIEEEGLKNRAGFSPLIENENKENMIIINNSLT